MTISWVISTIGAHKTITVASKDPKISKHGTANHRKHITLTIPQKCEVIRWLESGEAEERLGLHTTRDHQLGMI